MKLEVIKCRCGANIAACHYVARDTDWINKRDEYVRRGYATETITENFQFGECSCKDSWNATMKEFINETDNEIPSAVDLIVWLEDKYNVPTKK